MLLDEQLNKNIREYIKYSQHILIPQTCKIHILEYSFYLTHPLIWQSFKAFYCNQSANICSINGLQHIQT